MVIEEGIFYSTDPMGTMKKALKKSNQELLALIKIRPMTEEIKERISDLRKRIVQYGVSGISEKLYELFSKIFISVILVLYFLYDLIN